MTNFEFYKDKLQQLAADDAINIGLRNGEPINCDKIKCNECDFHGNTCCSNLVTWLYQEYEPYVDWNKIEVDTPVLVSNDGKNWYRRYFATYESDKVYAFQGGLTSWTSLKDPMPWKYTKLKEYKNYPNESANSSNVYQEAEKALEKYPMKHISI